MELIAALLLGFFFAGYFVLGGADIGLGMLLPYLGREESERQLAVAGVWPVFLANEVWLVATAGVFIGCFPALEGELFSGLVLVLVPLLAGWMIRDAGLWWGRQAPRAGFWLTVVGSWTLALSWGWLIASLLTDTPTEPAPPALGAVTSLAIALLFLAHGMGFAALRLSGVPFERARQVAGRGAGGNSFALTSAVMFVLPLLAGARLPLSDSAASDTALRLVVPALLVILPLLLAGQVWLWRTFGRRVEGPAPAYF
ncbi:cytochrome d ubiquinol oxidase subunit II [Streptomyces litchfieldiae]|uniref:Cytochrome d ubiquinol oxidase subunit II n=1 Tax=Streptomyces litchfieldiae TaxID=3075543 RepID=A0ABU2MPU5_9ACTN|nr:cytochrome d ubiquinol oxidase subunit II [Streptomyces sp. DSM 44938]MDT0343378.1 cytochrome d ubiquinol oxidase subunit II [Streptomyces sp. DSM 44938]